MDDHFRAAVRIIDTTRGNVRRNDGMYGRQEPRFYPRDVGVRQTLGKYAARLLTKEHVDDLVKEGMLKKIDCMSHVEPFLLSALRLCQHDTREELVRKLKEIGKLPDDFPKLHKRSPAPVPGTISFTALDNVAKVFRIFLERHAESHFPTSNKIIAVVNAERLALRDFSNNVEVNRLIVEVQAYLPELAGDPLMRAWQEEIIGYGPTQEEKRNQKPKWKIEK